MLGFCITGIQDRLTHKREPRFYVHFKQILQAVWLLQKKNALEVELLEFILTPLPSKLVKLQSTPMWDIRLDGMDHMANWNEKKERCRQCLDDNTYVSCCKCNFWLCFNTNRNCFKSYHGH